MQNNQLYIIGTIQEPFEYDHTVQGERFYRTSIATIRTSGYKDVLPVITSEHLIDVNIDLTGYKAEVSGSFRSFSRKLESGKKIKSMYIFIDTLSMMEDQEAADTDEVTLCGALCTPPVYRTTPLGRELTEACIAVNRNFNKTDYINIITWSRMARRCAELVIGDVISITGRIQSREYQKVLDTGDIVTKMAYEVSVFKYEYMGSNIRRDIDAGSGASSREEAGVL